MFNKIQIRLYYDSEGHLYTYGNKNKIPTLNKLSNYAYELIVVCPFPNEDNVMYYNYEKADGTQNDTPIPLAYIGRESVKVIVDNEEVSENWYVYSGLVEDNVLSISTPQHTNTLKISPTINWYEIVGYDNVELQPLTITHTLNFVATTLTCLYTLSSNNVVIEETPLDTIIAYINTALSYKVDKVIGLQVIPNTNIPTLPTWSANEKHKAYIFKDDSLKATTSYGKGDIIVAGDSGYVLLARGWDFIDDKFDEVYEVIEGLVEKTETILLTNTLVGVDDNVYILTQNETIGSITYRTGDIVKVSTINNIKTITILAYGKSYIDSLNDQIQGNKSNIEELENTITGYISEKIEQLLDDVDTLEQDVSDLESDVATHENRLDGIDTSIVNLSNIKLDKVFGLNIANEIADDDYLVINSNGVPYRITYGRLRQGFSSDHYKGDFNSLQALQQAYPTAEPGDYAFVNVDDDLVMYIWDDDDEEWKETTTDKYVLSVAFANYQQGISDGTIVVGKAKNYDNTSGSIKAKFDNVDSDIETLESQKQDTEKHQNDDFYETYDVENTLGISSFINAVVESGDVIDESLENFMSVINNNFGDNKVVAPFTTTQICIIKECDFNYVEQTTGEGGLVVYVPSLDKTYRYTLSKNGLVIKWSGYEVVSNNLIPKIAILSEDILSQDPITIDLIDDYLNILTQKETSMVYVDLSDLGFTSVYFTRQTPTTFTSVNSILNDVDDTNLAQVVMVIDEAQQIATIEKVSFGGGATNVEIIDKNSDTTTQGLFDLVKDAFDNGKVVIIREESTGPIYDFYYLQGEIGDSETTNRVFTFINYNDLLDKQSSANTIGVKTCYHYLSYLNGNYTWTKNDVVNVDLISFKTLTSGSQIPLTDLASDTRRKIVYVYNNEFYYFADEQSDHLVYTHVGMDNQQQTFIKNLYIYIDDSSVLYRTWTITSSEVQKAIGVNMSGATTPLTSLNINGVNYSVATQIPISSEQIELEESE